MDGGDVSDATLGEAEAGAEGVLVSGGGCLEEESEEVTVFSEDAEQELGNYAEISTLLSM